MTTKPPAAGADGARLGGGDVEEQANLLLGDGTKLEAAGDTSTAARSDGGSFNPDSVGSGDSGSPLDSNQSSPENEGEGGDITAGSGNAIPVASEELKDLVKREVKEQMKMLDDDSKIQMSDDDSKIPEDSFSMFYAASSWHEHVFPTCVFLLQMVILAFIGTNLVEKEEDPLVSNFNIPVDVPLTVTVSQYIACFVSAFTAQDLVTGMIYAHKPIKDEDYNGPPPISWKWELSNAMRTLVGLLVVFLSLIFIVQSTTVIDLFLNFAAVAFVSELDNTAFGLATNGFLGEIPQRLAKQVSDLHVDDQSGGGSRLRKRIAGSAIIVIVLWAALTASVIWQDNMNYACKRVYLEVGETRYAWARHFSGTYVREKEKINQRAVYLKYEGVKTFIAYCSLDERWIIGYLSKNLTSAMKWACDEGGLDLVSVMCPIIWCEKHV